MATIGSIASPGTGSGFDVDGIVSKLMAVEQQPLTTLATKEAGYQAKLSAFGNLSSALSAFQTAMGNLGKPSAFQSLKSNVGDSDILSATAGAKAAAGSYQIDVTQLAQAQILSTAGQSSQTASIGSGASTTISFEFGKISGGTLANGTYTGASFAQDATQSSGTVTIDSSNNSLQGIRDAINAANVGVTATLISDGSATPARLVLTSNETGESSSMRITVDGDPALQNLLSYDPASTQNMTQTSVAQNTQLTVNGIAITSATNEVDEAIQGMTLNVAKIGSTSLSVTQDTSTVTANINAFVKAYNDLNSQIASLTSYTPSAAGGTTPGQAGLLLGDSTVRNLQDSIRNTLTSSLSGLSNTSLSLSSIGVAFQKDGSLAVDATKLSDALSKSFNDIGGLFATVGKATDSLVNFSTSTTATKAGSYAINITQMATQAGMTGDANLNAGNTVIADNTELSIKLDGVETKVALTAGSYTASQLAAMVQSAINGAAAIKSASSSVTATIDANGHLNITSNRYGSASNITINDGSGTSAATLFGTVTQGTDGVDVAGTIGGQPATGSGQFLTGATGTSAEGLKLEIIGGATGDRGTINFSQGYADRLSKLSDSFLGTDGLIGSRTAGINASIKDINDQTDVLNKRLTLIEANYRAQFNALNLTLVNLQSTQTYLTQQLAAIAANTPTASSK